MKTSFHRPSRQASFSTSRAADAPNTRISPAVLTSQDAWALLGHEAPADVRELYIGKRVPDEFRKPGAANPIKCTWVR